MKRKYRTISTLKSIIYDNTKLKNSNNKNCNAKLIYIYLFNQRLINNKKIPTNKEISEKLNIDKRTIKTNLELLVNSGFIQLSNKYFEINYINNDNDFSLVDDDFIEFIKKPNMYDVYNKENCLYVATPEEIIFNKNLTSNEKIYYMIFLDFFMKNSNLTEQYYKICHLSKLIKEKKLDDKTVYNNFHKLKEKNFIDYESISYNNNDNGKGFIKLRFYIKPFISSGSEDITPTKIKKEEDSISLEDFIENKTPTKIIKEENELTEEEINSLLNLI